MSAENSGKPFGGRGSASNPAGELTALPQTAGGKGGCLPVPKNSTPHSRPSTLRSWSPQWKILGAPLNGRLERRRQHDNSDAQVQTGRRARGATRLYGEADTDARSQARRRPERTDLSCARSQRAASSAAQSVRFSLSCRPWHGRVPCELFVRPSATLGGTARVTRWLQLPIRLRFDGRCNL